MDSLIISNNPTDRGMQWQLKENDKYFIDYLNMENMRETLFEI